MKNLSFLPADILLPNKNIKINDWATIACDQYTSDKDYWLNKAAKRKGTFSTLDIILPEAFLQKDNSEYIKKINSNMQKMLDENIFTEYKNSYIFVRRKLDNGLIRNGIVGAIDLECYDYNEGSKSLCRASEKTVVSRLPARVNIRKNAPLEASHIMIFVDDYKKILFEKIQNQTDEMKLLYDSDIEDSKSHVEGYLLGEKQVAILNNAIEKFCDVDEFNKRFSLDCKDALCYAVGDGNHSLAAAKKHYEQIKEKLGDKALNHKARYALCEIVDIESKAIEFEAIHRILFNADLNDFENKFKSNFDGIDLTINDNVFMPYTTDAKTISDLIRFVDDYAGENNLEMDFIHGKDELLALADKNKNSVSVILPPIKKDSFFEGIAKSGVYPRKTFSMGSALEKRFYIECRKII